MNFAISSVPFFNVILNTYVPTVIRFIDLLFLYGNGIQQARDFSNLKKKGQVEKFSLPEARRQNEEAASEEAEDSAETPQVCFQI